MGLPKRRGGLPVLLSGSRQPGAWQAPRRPHDSDRPVPARGVRAFPVGPDREGRGEPRMGLPKRRGGLPVLLSGSRQPGALMRHGRPRGGRTTRIGRYRRAVCVRFPSARVGRGGENRGCAYRELLKALLLLQGVHGACSRISNTACS